VRLVLFGQGPYRTFVETAGELLGTPAGDDPESPL
jgi:hypothetical protein